MQIEILVWKTAINICIGYIKAVNSENVILVIKRS